MGSDKFQQLLNDLSTAASNALSQGETYTQIGLILLIYAVAFVTAVQFRKHIPLLGGSTQPPTGQPIRTLCQKVSNLLFPLIAIILLKITLEVSAVALEHRWVLHTALTIAVLILFNSAINDFIRSPFIVGLARYIGTPILFLHLVGVLPHLTQVLETISISIGNIEISAYGMVRVLLFGSILFWFGRVSNNTGKDLIRRQEKLDIRTREVAIKLFEVVIYVVIFLLLLQVMGINLTALAVFGGALGVGLGFGLQAIASNFISGIIILLDRSISNDDYIELEDGRCGFVREMNMRSTTLETYDGKDIMVPNEKFIVESFTNWTHKNKKQRYRVDFSVAYSSNVRQLVEIIKEVVSAHPQVIAGDDIPMEERPDCEIDSFGDNGINMFVEFWMEGIDDGKNRVGGDLLLMILEALQQNGFEIPYPQREVRILKEKPPSS